MDEYRKSLIERCENYRADDDATGSVGHSLADELMKAFPEKYSHPLISEETPKKDWEKFYKIIKKEKVRLMVPSRRRQMVKRVLGKLKRAGANIDSDYQNMETSKMWNYFVGVKKNIVSHCL